MQKNLFDVHYPADFEEAWKVYRYPRCSKADALKAWNQTVAVRPETTLLCFAIIEYLEHIKSKRQYQLHFATFLRRCMWEPFMTEARMRKQYADDPTLIPKPRPSFRSTDYDWPPPGHSKPTRTAAQILAERRK